jgi:phosphoribosylglycinamide formyltransferase 1
MSDKEIKHNSKDMKFVFLASANHIKPTIVLKQLAADGFLTPVNTVIFTDKNKGRFFRLIKRIGFPYKTTSNSKEIGAALEKLKPDFLICCSWHTIIPEKVINIPRIASLNCHNSVLPDYKGASPFKHYWSNWEPVSGASVHYMTKELDAGNILAKSTYRVKRPTSPINILKQSSRITPPLLKKAIHAAAAGDEGEKQAGGRYFAKMSNTKHIVFWVVNGIAVFLGKRKKLTPHKVKH